MDPEVQFHVWMAAWLRSSQHVEHFVEAVQSLQAQTVPPQQVCIAVHGEFFDDPLVSNALAALESTTRVRVIASREKKLQAEAYKAIADTIYKDEDAVLPHHHVAFLDADDLYVPQRLERMQLALATAQLYGTSCAMGLSPKFWNDKEMTSEELSSFMSSLTVPQEKQSELLLNEVLRDAYITGENFAMIPGSRWDVQSAETATLCLPLGLWLRYLSTIMLEDLTGKDCEDMRWTSELIQTCGSAVLIWTEPLYRYRVWKGSLCWNICEREARGAHREAHREAHIGLFEFF